MTCEMLVEVMSKDDHKIDPIQIVFFREVDKIDGRYIIFKSVDPNIKSYAFLRPDHYELGFTFAEEEKIEGSSCPKGIWFGQVLKMTLSGPYIS